ncbi:MAG: hypothetical protein Q9222_007235, partial [Ikaeria aurantiellina]
MNCIPTLFILSHLFTNVYTTTTTIIPNQAEPTSTGQSLPPTGGPSIPFGSMDGFLLTIGTPPTLTQPVGIFSWDTLATPTLTTEVTVSGEPSTMTVGPADTPIPLMTIMENNGAVVACVQTVYTAMGARTGCILGWETTIKTATGGPITSTGAPYQSNVPTGSVPDSDSQAPANGNTDASAPNNINTDGGPDDTNTGGDDPGTTQGGFPTVTNIDASSLQSGTATTPSGTGSGGSQDQDFVGAPGMPINEISRMQTHTILGTPANGVMPTKSGVPTNSGESGIPEHSGTNTTPAGPKGPTDKGAPTDPGIFTTPKSSFRSGGPETTKAPANQGGGPHSDTRTQPGSFGDPAASSSNGPDAFTKPDLPRETGTPNVSRQPVPPTEQQTPANAETRDEPGAPGQTPAPNPARTTGGGSPDIFADPSQSNTIITTDGKTETYDLTTLPGFATLTGTTTSMTDYTETQPDG